MSTDGAREFWNPARYPGGIPFVRIATRSARTFAAGGQVGEHAGESTQLGGLGVRAPG